MLTTTPYIVDMFRYIVADVNTNYDDSEVRYEHGHPLEVIETLQALSKSPKHGATKFPLIALFQDFEEEKGTRRDIESKVKLTLAIVQITDPLYKAALRYDNTFKAVLYPLYALLITSIVQSGYFANISKALPPKHKKTDRLYWGKSGLYGNTSNQFNDFVDAIEIADLELEVWKQHCSPNSTFNIN